MGELEVSHFDELKKSTMWDFGDIHVDIYS